MTLVDVLGLRCLLLSSNFNLWRIFRQLKGIGAPDLEQRKEDGRWKMAGNAEQIVKGLAADTLLLLNYSVCFKNNSREAVKSIFNLSQNYE